MGVPLYSSCVLYGCLVLFLIYILFFTDKKKKKKKNEGPSAKE